MNPNRPFKIVMLTNGHPHGRKILEELEVSRIKFDSIILETKPYFSHHLNNKHDLRFISFIKALRRWIISTVKSNKQNKLLGKYSRVLNGGPINGELMCRILQNIKPDFIVLGGIGIVSQDLINTARYGVLNAHPGLLPWIRGTGVVARAIERDIPIGGTCHFVDSKVDTGPIIERRLLPVYRKCSLEELAANADDLVVSMMVDLIKTIQSDGSMPHSKEQVDKFPVCKWVDADEMNSINFLINQGKPQQLFTKWVENCIDKNKFVLRTDFDEADLN